MLGMSSCFVVRQGTENGIFAHVGAGRYPVVFKTVWEVRFVFYVAAAWILLSVKIPLLYCSFDSFFFPECFRSHKDAQVLAQFVQYVVSYEQEKGI